MAKEIWIQRYERALERLAEQHEFDPFEIPEHIKDMAAEIANNP
jgi:hypothetical protein